MPISLPNLDDRTFTDLVQEMRALIPRYAPTWTDHNVSDPGITLIELFAWLTEALIYRINRIPQASEARFLELLGVSFLPAQPATVKINILAKRLADPDFIPKDTPLTVQAEAGGRSWSFLTTRDFHLTESPPPSSLEARQVACTKDESLGVSNGYPHQLFTLSNAYLLLDDQLEVKVDNDTWSCRPSLLDSSPSDQHYTVEPRLNAIRFGNGVPEQISQDGETFGQIPPEGAEIVASYHHTLGNQGNVRVGTKLSFNLELEQPTDSTVRDALDAGVEFELTVQEVVSVGTASTSLDEAHDMAIGALKTRWRVITAEDFEELVTEQSDFNLARARCLPEVDPSASGSDDDSSPGHVSIIVVTRPTSEPQAVLAPQSGIANMIFSPDGKLLAIAGATGAQIWDTASGTLTTTLRHDEAVDAMLFSPDGLWFATAGRDHIARVWNSATWGTVVEPLPVVEVSHEAPISTLTFSPNSWWFASASQDNTVNVWDLISDEEDATEIPLPHDEAVRDVVFSPNGARLATLSGNEVRIWSVPRWSAMEEVLEHDGTVQQAVFSPDGQVLAVAGEDNNYTVRIWNTEDWQQVADLNHGAPVEVMVFSANGRALTTKSGNTFQSWTRDTWAKKEPPFTYPELSNVVAFSPDLKWVVTASDDHPQVWDVDSESQTATLHHDFDVIAAVFSPDGRRVVTLSENPVEDEENIINSSDQNNFNDVAKVWDVESGAELAVFSHKMNRNINRLVFSPKGGLLVSGADDGKTAWLWKADYIDDVWSFLDERRLITCQHHVVGPAFTDVYIETDVVGQTNVNQDNLRRAIQTSLQNFFHPLTGGPEAGWPFGRDVYISEVYQLIEGIEGVDHVDSLTLHYRKEDGDWADAGNQIPIPANSLVHLVIQRNEITIRAGR